MMSKTRTPETGNDRIRSDALLLPASLRYDWQHSSSQLPITNMTPAGPPPPAGVIVFVDTSLDIAPRAEGSGQTHAAGAWVPFPAGATARRLPALQDIHRSGDALLLPASPDRIGGPPPKLPIDISNARRFSSPGGRCFLRRTQRKCITRFNLCGKSSNFSQNSARISA